MWYRKKERARKCIAIASTGTKCSVGFLTTEHERRLLFTSNTLSLGILALSEEPMNFLVTWLSSLWHLKVFGALAKCSAVPGSATRWLFKWQQRDVTVASVQLSDRQTLSRSHRGSLRLRVEVGQLKIFTMPGYVKSPAWKYDSQDWSATEF